MTTLLTVIEIIGVFSFSISGALMAIDKENDFVGVIFLALITSFGGGMLRDIFIGNTPPEFFELYLLVIVSVVTSVAVFILAAVFKKQYVRNERFIESINNYFDALGLGVFVVSGVQICINAGETNPFLIILMGMLSGTGGSMVRDIIMNEIPAILRKRIYLLAALLGASVCLVILRSGANEIVAVSAGATIIIMIRLFATIFKWNMPKAIDFSKMSRDEDGDKK